MHRFPSFQDLPSHLAFNPRDGGVQIRRAVPGYPLLLQRLGRMRVLARFSGWYCTVTTVAPRCDVLQGREGART